MLEYIKMIVYRAVRINNNLILRRWYKKRTSDKHKRLHQDMRRLRKKWWHFKTRWERNEI